MNATVKDVMSTHVIAVGQSARYKEVAAMLRDQRVSAFPVIDDDNKVIGVVSETDLLTKPPVTSDDGTLLGIVSRCDVLSVYSRPDAEIQHQVSQDLILGNVPMRPGPGGPEAIVRAHRDQRPYRPVAS